MQARVAGRLLEEGGTVLVIAVQAVMRKPASQWRDRWLISDSDTDFLIPSGPDEVMRRW